ncbi:MAG: twin-arginine translocase subunit TatC [Actinomycetota bacterium]|nr:twin-arginine translocase subunit TatC [Actinomycetota bacterium]
MPLVEHLAELRRRLIISVIAIAVGGLVAFFLYNWILRLLIEPYTDLTGKDQLVFTDPLEGLTTRLKISAYGGLLLASPVVLWQFWRFITPGLHKNEKRYAIPFILASIFLFLLGAFVALLTFKPALNFLISMGGPNLETFFTASKYLGLVTLMMIAFGLAFEFPIVLIFLEIAGVVTSQRLRKWRRPALVIIVAGAAIITPSGDPYSLFAMAVPMYLFFEGAILVGRLLKK